MKQGVILVLDGTRVEEFYVSDDETLSDAAALLGEHPLQSVVDDLLPLGAHVQPAYNTGVTITMPGHATLLQGHRRHFGSPPIQDDRGPELYRVELPTLFELVREQLSVGPSDVALFGNTVNIIGLDYSLHPSFGENLGTTFEMLTREGSEAPSNDDGAVVSQVRGALTAGARLVVANLHNIDRTAHNDPKLYADAASRTDEAIASLWQWIQSGELADQTMLIVTSDHGRHRDDAIEPVWTGHGDDCGGCREIPLVLLGPGVRAGASTQAPATLEDAHRTLTWFMGIDSPYADGLVLSELLNLGDAVPVQRSGDTYPARDGDLSAHMRWRDDAHVRSEIVLDGQTMTGEAFTAEAPAVHRGDSADHACWRELSLGGEYMPWKLRCVQRAHGDTEWTELGSPLERVHSDTQPSLSENADGQLVVAWEDILVTNVMDMGTNSQISVAFQTEKGWEVLNTHSRDGMAIEPSLQIQDDTLWIALARGDSTSQNRYTRHVEVSRIDKQTDGSWQWVLEHSTAALTDGTIPVRMEHPALWVNQGQVRLAYVRQTDAGAMILLTEKSKSWTSPVVLDDQAVLPHVRPVWSEDGALFWARMGDKHAELCRWRSAGFTTCTDLPSAHVAHIAPISGSQVLVSLVDGDMAWTRHEVAF